MVFSRGSRGLETGCFSVVKCVLDQLSRLLVHPLEDELAQVCLLLAVLRDGCSAEKELALPG